MAFGLQFLRRVEQSLQPDPTFNTVDSLVTGSGPRMWSYNASAAATGGSNDNAAATQAGNYFLPIYGYLNQGDLIYVYSNDPGYHLLNVATSSSAGVTTAQIV